MKPIPFLAALLVIVSMTMPWFTAQTGHPLNGGTMSYKSFAPNQSSTTQAVSFWDVVKSIYTNEKHVKDCLKLEANKTSLRTLISFLSAPLILLGAVIGLFKGKFGHGVGLIGMVLLTVMILYWGNNKGTLTVGIGYLLAWVGFAVGFVASAGSK